MAIGEQINEATVKVNIEKVHGSDGGHVFGTFMMLRRWDRMIEGGLEGLGIGVSKYDPDLQAGLRDAIDRIGSSQAETAAQKKNEAANRFLRAMGWNGIKIYYRVLEDNKPQDKEYVIGDVGGKIVKNFDFREQVVFK